MIWLTGTRTVPVSSDYGVYNLLSTCVLGKPSTLSYSLASTGKLYGNF
jgi:hypothetical protein